MLMKRENWKELGVDILVDIAASILIAVGVYNFALHANFPVAGFSGIAIICYHLFKIPVGIGTILLNIPVAIFCYKFLHFFFLHVVQHQFFEQGKQPYRIEMNKEIGDTYIQVRVLLLHPLKKDKDSTCHRIGILRTEVFQG